MTMRERMRRGDAGVALLTALAVLGICMMLGWAYVGYMMTEREDADLKIHNVRARMVAEAGVQAAIAKLQQSLETYEFDVAVPMYGLAEEGALEASTDVQGSARVRVSDEAARLNVNYAPVRMLSAVLGINPEEARALRSRLPRIPGEDVGDATGAARWLTSVDELGTRIPPEAFEKVNRDLLTVYTVADPTDPAGFVNLNTASPAVIAAVLGIGTEAAQKVYDAARQKPFTSAEEVLQAAGGAGAIPDGALPKEAAFASRTYRVASEGVVWKEGEPLTGAVVVEAVVQFDETGQARIRYWHESRGDRPAAAEAQAEPAPAAPANPA